MSRPAYASARRFACPAPPVPPVPPSFQPSESLKALVFFGDGDLSTLSGDEKATLVAAVAAVRSLPEVAVVSRQLGTRA